MSSAIFPAIFLFLLELSALIFKSYAWLFLFGAVIVSMIGAWRTTRQKMSLPAIFFFAVLSVLFVGASHSFWITQLAIVIAAVLFYVALSAYSKRLILPVTLFNFLVFLAGTFSLLVYQAAGDIFWLSVAASVFFFSALLFFSCIYFSIGNKRSLMLRILFFSLVVGFIMTEFYFALSVLPFNLVSIDFLMFIIYYGLWDMAWHYFSGKLTKKSLLLDALIILISFIAVFLSAKWFP